MVMHQPLLTLAFGIAMAVLSCSRVNSPDQNESPHAGMVKIHSSGQWFDQGWNDSSASPDEKPVMHAHFTYDFWLDTVEITQKRYHDYAGLKPVADTSSYGTGDDYPVYYVSWFDAVLFCNARSKAEILDTVYRYSHKDIANGSVYNLTGLLIDVTRDGYRLPTESEWEYAARGGSLELKISDSAQANNDAWYDADAAGKAHPVALKRPNAFGLYDMAGNVFEWTNDWKGMYTGANIINSLGALQPGNAYEKVIKGGAYNSSLTYIRPSHRSATYPTTLSAFNEYVGFRCARGAIPGGQYIGNTQQQIVTNPVSVNASGANFRSFIGSSDLKIVFVNVTGNIRTLCSIDFSTTFPYCREYTDDRSVYMPSISPDGHYVAYCSNNVGLYGPSKITIRSLDSLGSPLIQLAADSAYIPRWWIDRSTGAMYIIYTNSAIPNSSSLWNDTKTFRQKILGGQPFGLAEQLNVQGGYHDGLSSDGHVLVTGYNRLMTMDLITGSQRQLFTSPHNGKDAGGSAQVCNVSLSPDTGAATRCMFLDFGYDKTSSLTGSSYGIHQYVFIASLDDSVVNFLRCPQGEGSWDNPAWTNCGQFAVSCVRNTADQAHGIYCIDLVNHSLQPMVSGVELQQPSCRIGAVVENRFNFSLDSIGNYDDPHVVYGQTLFSYMMHFFWSRCDDLDMVFIGNSQVQAGIDCSIFKSRKAINIAFPGCGLLGARTIIQDYIIPHASRIQCIGMNVFLNLFGFSMAENNPTWWSGSIGQSKGFLYDQNHGFWNDSLFGDFKKVLSALPYNPNLVDVDTLGFSPNSCNGWGGSNPEIYGFPEWSLTDSVVIDNLSSFVKLIESVSALRIHLIVVLFPESPFYKNTESYTIAGPSWKTGRAFVAQFRALEAQYPYFHFYDAYQDGNNDYTDAEAWDWDHLCAAGARKLTQRIDKVLDSILISKKAE